jgi:hypothetical protein|tara:strand:- start:3132 stop:4178 length:1047 start_codon:yes stop_codon:yes gene_type:complete
MGFLSNMFGGRGDAIRKSQRRMHRAYGRQADFARDMLARYREMGSDLRGELEGLGEEVRSTMLGLYSDMENDRDDYLRMVSDEFNTTLSRMDADSAEARESLSGFYERAFDELATGRDATLALLEQQNRDEVARTQQGLAFGGMGGSSFGASAVSSAEAQGALRAGAVREQYGARLAGQLNLAGQGLAEFDQRAASQRQQVEAARLNTYLGGFESYQQRLQGLRMGAETGRLDLMRGGISAEYGARGQGLASYENQYGAYVGGMIGADTQAAQALLKRDMSDIGLGRQLIGAGLSAVTGGLAGGFGSMAAGGGFGAGFSAGLGSYFGGGGFGGAYNAGVFSAAPSAVQ